MDGIRIPLLGALVSVALLSLCLAFSRLRGFAFASLIAPFTSSVVLLFGSFVFADMNPAREYGAAYIATGSEHDPTNLDRLLLCLAVGATFVIAGCLSFTLQRLTSRFVVKQVDSMRRHRAGRVSP